MNNRRDKERKLRYFSMIYDRILAYFIKSKESHHSPPLFIMGSGRNGSTLISSILNNHPKIFIPPEKTIIPFAIRYWHLHPFVSWNKKIDVIFEELSKPSMWVADFNDLKSSLKKCPLKNQNINYILHNIYMEYAGIYKKDNEIIWGDKTPSNTLFISLIKKQFKGSKVLFLIRDPRAVMSSFLEMIYSNNDQRFDFLMWRWKISILKYKQLKRQYPNEVLLMKYEDFVSNPSFQTQQIVEWLGLDYLDDLLLNRQANMAVLGVENVTHHQNVKNEISAKSIEKWKDRLDPILRAKIEQYLKSEMRYFNYL